MIKLVIVGLICFFLGVCVGCALMSIMAASGREAHAKEEWIEFQKPDIPKQTFDCACCERQNDCIEYQRIFASDDNKNFILAPMTLCPKEAIQFMNDLSKETENDI